MTKNSALRNAIKGCLSIYFVFLFLLSVTSFNMIKQRFNNGTLFLTGHESECKAVDFVSAYMTSLIAKRSATQHDCFIYDTDIQFAITNEILKPVTLGAKRVVEYPPYFYTFMYPLSFFSLKGAWLVWDGCNLVLLIIALVYIARKESFSWADCGLILIWALAYGPVMTCLQSGQMAIWLAAGLTSVWLLLEKQKYVLAAFATAFGIVKIQYLPFVVICGLVLGRKKYVLGLIAAFTTLLLPCVFLFGPRAVFGYPNVILFNDGSRWSTLQYMENIRAQIFCLLPIISPSVLFIVSACLMLMAMIIQAYIWLRYYPKLLLVDKDAFKVCAAVSTLMMLSFSLHTFAYDYVASLVPCIWLYRGICDFPSPATIVYRRSLKYMILFFPLIYLGCSVLQQKYPTLECLRFPCLINCVVLLLCLKIFLSLSKSGTPTSEQEPLAIT